ncbi:MAG: J domain-containing protein [Proteobacteria bacterium]|nr:J domain-containing protein [Pseudomonadota bacterium]
MDFYKAQLARQQIYVEAFEGAPKGTDAQVKLEIRETQQKIVIDTKVERPIGKKEAVELGYGQRPGLILNVTITPDLVEPLRAFFLAQGPARPTAAPIKQRIPFEDIANCTLEQVEAQVDQFLAFAEKGNLFQLFNVRPNVEKKELRSIYNVVVRVLHPDAHGNDYPENITHKLEDAYQIFNEAYKILQNPVQSKIYLEISRANRIPNGMSLNDYKKWQADYRMKNATNIHKADELMAAAEDALMKGNTAAAEQNKLLALQYDPYNESAHAMIIS